MNPVRVAVVGAGQFGKNHLRVLKQIPEADLTAVVDIRPDAAQAAAAEYGVSALSLEDLPGRVEAVVVAVPTLGHAEVACRLLSSGIDVLVEKPIAAGTEEARMMVETAATHGRVLQVGHLERFNPAVQAASRVLTTPLFFEIHRLSTFSPRSLDVDVVLDLMIHDLDILLSMTNSHPSEVRAAGIPVLSAKADIANVRLAFPNGCIANLTASRVSTERVRKLRLFQPRQYVSIDYARQDLLVLGVDDKNNIQFMPQQVTKQEPLIAQAVHFMNCVRQRSTPLVDGQAGLRALELASSIIATMEEHTKLVNQSLRPIS